MAQKDWEDVYQKLTAWVGDSFNEQLKKAVFFPSETFQNIFNPSTGNLSASQLKKEKPGQWIPIYKREDLPKSFLEYGIMPIRAGSAEFFLYYGDIFYDLASSPFVEINAKDIHPIENFIPATLRADFQRNENAYLNKAVALGYINHFLESSNEIKVFEHEIETKRYNRLLYGQFGKIKMSKDLEFLTSKGSKTIRAGFLFEIDLVLENEDEIIIFEAKATPKGSTSFSLLQLYYPLIYIRSILNKSEQHKRIRTIFIDIISNGKTEIYKLIEFHFKDNFFDQWEVVKSFSISGLKDD